MLSWEGSPRQKVVHSKRGKIEGRHMQTNIKKNSKSLFKGERAILTRDDVEPSQEDSQEGKKKFG